ncbi:hypothetical protein GmHk_06G015831 [Glycine max]|nr:hypothetical protein GmHk_06G015831 [Glycine max]
MVKWVIVHAETETVFSDSIQNSSTSLTPFFLQSDSQRAIFHLGFPAQFPDFHFPLISTVARVNLKCASPVDPWRDSVDFEFRCLNKNNKKRYKVEGFPQAKETWYKIQ